jgi:pimeloyl-ACP methyl ester carboxylesterase
MPQDHYLDLATGIRAHYLAWPATGGAPKLLLNHATGFLGRLWEPVVAGLGAFSVYAPDTRGHGDTDKPPAEGDNYHWSRFAEDMRALLDALGLEGIAFAGHSAGAAVGMYVAAHYPQYFTRIVAIEPIIMPASFPQDEARRSEMAEGARRRRTVFDSAAEAFQQYRSRPLFERWPDDVLRLYLEHGTFQREDGRLQLKCPGEVEGAVFANSASLDTWSILPRLEVPVLVVRGEHTNPFLHEVASAVAERLPDARLETMPDAGHLLPMERPAATAALIRDFLAW